MRKLLKIIFGLAGIFLAVFGWFFFRVYQTAQLDQAQPADAIAVLGAAQYAGKPSPVFEARLEHAYELFQKGIAPYIITTGGTFPGEKNSEGEVGKKYLVGRGVPAEKIFTENQSQTTKQNMTRISEIAKERRFAKIIIVSDPFHMYRAVSIAHDLRIDALPSPTQTSPISKKPWLEAVYMGRETLLSVLHIFFDI
ncbi:MAG: YdcF family protein [Patescibacteria group bacterium]